MWRNTRMVALVGLSAAMYAAGIVVLRSPPPLYTMFVGQLILMPLCLLFGPAGAWGAVFGSVVSDIVTGNLQIGTLVGCFGNLVLGSLPYLLWSRLRPLARGNRELTLKGIREYLSYGVIAASSAFATAIVIAWPMNALGLVPFRFLLLLIGVQDAAVRVLSIVLLASIYSRIRPLGLVWWELLENSELDDPRRWTGVLGAWLTVAAAMVFFFLGALNSKMGPAAAGIATLLITIALVLMW